MRLLVLVVLALSVAPAGAQPRKPTPEAIRQAKSHFKQGKAFLDQKLYDDAIRELQQAYELSPLPELLFNIAQAYRLKGDNDKALATYQQFLQLEPDGALPDEARTHVAYLTADKEKRDAEARAQAEAAAKAKAEADARRAAEEAAAAEQLRQDEDRKRREAVQHQRDEEERVKREAEEARLAEIHKREAAAAALRDAWNDARDQRAKQRRRGYKYAIVGASCVGVATAFGLLGLHENSSVQGGGFATSGDIGSALTTGKVANYLAYGFLIPGVIGLGFGIPMIALHLDQGEYKVEPTATTTSVGLVLSGTLP